MYLSSTETIASIATATDAVENSTRPSHVPLDRYARLRLQQTPSVRSGHLLEFNKSNEHRRCRLMSSQF